MSTTLTLTVALVACAAVALGVSVYLAVRPRPTARSSRFSPVAWHLVHGVLTAACAGAASACVLAVVALQTA